MYGKFCISKSVDRLNEGKLSYLNAQKQTHTLPARTIPLQSRMVLKGLVDASGFKVYIFPLLFFKRISDVYDEEFRIALEESNGDAD